MMEWFPQRRMTAGQGATLRRSLWWTSAGIALAIPVQGLTGSLTASMFALQGLYAATLAGVALLFARCRTALHEYLLSLAGIALSLAFYFAAVLLGGGTESIAYHWLMAFGLVIALMGRGVFSSSLLIGVSVSGFSLYVPMMEGAGVGALRHELVDSGAFLLVIVVGSFLLQHFSDIEHEREEREKQRLMGARMEMVGKLAAGVAHEVNNPLGAIRSNLEFLRKQLGANNPEHAEVLAETMESLARIQRIVLELKDFARQDADERARVPVAELLAESVRLASATLPANVRLETSGLDLAAQLEVSPRRFVQVVVHLLLNAAEGLQGAGRDDGLIQVRAEAAGRSMSVSVEDDGPGIPLDLLPRLFDDFFSSRATKAGQRRTFELGLAVAQEFAHLNGGTIDAQPRAGGGSRFVLTLPLAAG